MTFEPNQIESALRLAEALSDPAAREAARQVARSVLDLHRAGLSSLVEILRAQGETGAAILGKAAAEPSVAALLALHDLQPPAEPAFVPRDRLTVRPTPRPEASECAACELCGQPVPAEHAHLFAVHTRTLACSCRACAVLFDAGAGSRYRRVRTRAQSLALALSEARWEELAVPVGLAFFRRTSPHGGVIAAYPGPAGAVETEVDTAAWERLTRENPAVSDLEPDVEALLVNRLDRVAAAYWRLSIDHCYRLTALVRRRWRGVSGGDEVVPEVRRFFQSLEEVRA
jgi:hypothetical protein